MQQSDLSRLAQLGYRLTPATFAHKITGGAWIPAAHLREIAVKVAMAVRQRSGFIIISLPPRHGKSELTSVHTPIWHLNEYPERSVILASYGSDLSTGFSRRVRDTIAEDEYGLMRTKLRDDARNVAAFITAKGGAMYAVGIGGALTGRGAHLLLIDDYIKNHEDAQSAAQRDKSFEWFKSTAYTRLEPGGVVAIVATRWDVDDLIGKILQSNFRDRVTYIRIPALAEAGDILGRAPGQALWPARYDEEALANIKDLIGTYWFEAEYQQNPLPSMAGIVRGDMLREVDILPHKAFLKVIRSWDFASSEGEGDWTVGIKYAKHLERREYYILDIVREQYHADGVETLVKRIAHEDQHSHFPPEKIVIEQEPGSAGKIVANHFKKTVLPEYAVDFIPVSGRIEVRASPFLAAIEAGRVHCLKESWLEEFKLEINRFPSGDFDDQVSAGAQAHNQIANAGGGVIWGEQGSKIQLPGGGVLRGVDKPQIITGATF